MIKYTLHNEHVLITLIYVIELDQLKIGPKTFQLQRLLAIYLSLREEDKGDISERYSTKETREDIYSYVSNYHKVTNHITYSSSVGGFGSYAVISTSFAAGRFG
jgi:hypothetical protein